MSEDPTSALGLLSSLDEGESGLSALDALKSNDDDMTSGLSLLGSLGDSNGGEDSGSALDLLGSGGSALDALGGVGNGGSALDLLGSGTSVLENATHLLGGDSTSSLLDSIGTSSDGPSGLSGLLGTTSPPASDLLGGPATNGGSSLGLLTSGGNAQVEPVSAPMAPEPMDVDFGPPPGEAEDDGFIDIRASTDLTLNPEMAATMSSQPRDDRPGRGRGRGGGRGGLFRSDMQKTEDGRKSPKREEGRQGADKENQADPGGRLLIKDTTGYLDQSEKIDTTKDPSIVSSLVDLIPRNTRMSLTSRLRRKGYKFYSIKQMRSRLWKLRRKDFKLVRFNMKFRGILSNPPVISMDRLSPTVTCNYEWPPLPPTWKERRRRQIELDKIEEAKFQLAYAKLQRQAGMGGNAAKEEKLRALIEQKKMKELYQRTGQKPPEDRKHKVIRDRPVYKSSFQSALGSFKIGKKKPSERVRTPSPEKDSEYTTYGLTGLALPGVGSTNPSRGGFAGRGRVFRSSAAKDYVSPLMRNQPQKTDSYGDGYSRTIIKDGGKLTDIMKGRALGALPTFEGGGDIGETAQTNVAIVGMVTDNKVVGCAEPEKPGAIPTGSSSSGVNPFAPPPMASGSANPFAPKPQVKAPKTGTPTYQDPRGTPTYSDPSRTPVYSDPPMTPSYQEPPATPAYQDSPKTPLYQEPTRKPASYSSRPQPKAAPVVNPNAFVEGLSDDDDDDDEGGTPLSKKTPPAETKPKPTGLSAAAALIKKSKPPSSGRDDKSKSAKAFMDKVGLPYKPRKETSSSPSDSASRSPLTSGGAPSARSAFVEGLSDDDEDEAPPPKAPAKSHHSSKPPVVPSSKPPSSSHSKPASASHPSKDSKKSSSSNLMASLNQLRAAGKSDGSKSKPPSSDSKTPKPTVDKPSSKPPSGGNSLLQAKLAMLKKKKPAASSEPEPPKKEEPKMKTPAQLRQLMSFLLKNPKSVLNTNPAMGKKAQQLLPILIEMEMMAKKKPESVQQHLLKPISDFLDEATGKKK